MEGRRRTAVLRGRGHYGWTGSKRAARKDLLHGLTAVLTTGHTGYREQYLQISFEQMQFLCDQSNQLWIITVEHWALLRASALYAQEEHDAVERMKAWILTSTLQMT